MKRFDAHAHLPLRTGAAAALLAAMDSCEIDRACVVAGGNLTPRALSEQMVFARGADVDIDNEALRSQCDSDGRGRLLPFYFANPHRGAQRYRAEGASFYGLKLGPAIHGVRFNDERTVELLFAAREFGHTVYLHCLGRPGFGVADFVAVARRFPDVNFILGHAGVGHFDFYGVDLIKPHPRIYFETSGGFSSVVRYAIEELGADRILFGSEYPLQDPRIELAKFANLNLPTESLVKVTSTNIARLISGGHHG